MSLDLPWQVFSCLGSKCWAAPSLIKLVYKLADRDWVIKKMSICCHAECHPVHLPELCVWYCNLILCPFFQIRNAFSSFPVQPASALVAVFCSICVTMHMHRQPLLWLIMQPAVACSRFACCCYLYLHGCMPARIMAAFLGCISTL